jgi:hypothetical protein
MFNTVVIPEGLPRVKYEREVERMFADKRGTPGFIFSPADWRILESWKTSKVPLAVALRGIEKAFRHRRGRNEQINSLAFCSPAVLAEWREYRKREAA